MNKCFSVTKTFTSRQILQNQTPYKRNFSVELEKKPIATIKAIISSGEATSQPPLGPTLGQYQINIATFTKEFNAKSDQTYEKGIPLNVKIYKYADKTYSVDIRGPILASIIKNVTNESGEIPIEDLYDVCLAHSKKINNTPEVAARNVLGYLSSMRPHPKIADKAAVPKPKTK